MAVATDSQVQTWANTRTRVRAQQIRALYNDLVSDNASIDDVYNALTVQSPTWTDGRTDAPPHLLSPGDVLAMNSLAHAIVDAINNSGQYPVCQKACVQAPGS